MLLQLPHFTKELAKKCQENPGKSIEIVFDLAEMEDDERRELLQMPDSQLMAIVRNRYPNIDLTYVVVDGDNVRAGEDVSLQVTLERDLEGKTERKAKVKLDFAALGEAGKKNYTLYFMCDSYMGWDQEYSFAVDVKEAALADDS
ncbi:hypothetical protein Vadar_021615 [Vaccinium darrowii]|uniref:Uncharacterized protein n=1 Tax=Vaccinium darrowii TaxID=229202 RepID=A0ACB7YFL0_9ERIC|nr:hypothetical protein Vadar_021615 [Vaccinium darrowii]